MESKTAGFPTNLLLFFYEQFQVTQMQKIL